MTKLREVVFISQAWAEAMIPEGHESIISITDCGSPVAELNEGWQAILRLQFDDVDPDEATPGEFERGLVQISDAQANEIADFVFANATTSTALIVHCRFGQSRSPAIAKAVCEHYNLNFPPQFKSHNRFVHRLVLNAIAQHREA
jgi:predicted protein tyrosine phosphatase